MKPKVMVIDDEFLARRKIARLLRDDGRFELVEEASNGAIALSKLETTRVDVLFVDVEMPRMSGFEFVDALDLSPAPRVVFSTAYPQHAVRAFEVAAVDYLVKPYDAQRFARTLDRLHAQLDATPSSNVISSGERKRLVVRLESGWESISYSDIVRVSTAGKHVEIVTKSQETFLVRRTLRDILERLPRTLFVRTHRCEVVASAALVRVEWLAHGDGVGVLADGTSVVVSRTFRHDVIEALER